LWISIDLNPDPDLAFELDPDSDLDPGSEPKRNMKKRTSNKLCKIEFKVKKSEKSVLTEQELEPYGAPSSHLIGWSLSRKAMRTA
jgi:hypothetical protein